MPFYLDPEVANHEKRNVSLTQFRDAPAGRKKSKTWFRNLDNFHWAENEQAKPRDFEAVRAGMTTDLASVPRFMWGVVASYGRHTIPALLHDRGCDLAGLLDSRRYWMRRQVDHRFRQNLHTFASMGFFTRWMMWSAVRLFGALPVAILTIVATLGWFVGLTWSVPWSVTLAVVVSVLLVIFICYVSFEVQVDSMGLPANVKRAFSPLAFSSMLGAALVGGLAAIPILPLVTVTIVTNAVLSVLNFVAYHLGRGAIRVWNNVWKAVAFDHAAALPETLQMTIESVGESPATPAPEPPRFTFFPGP